MEMIWVTVASKSFGYVQIFFAQTWKKFLREIQCLRKLAFKKSSWNATSHSLDITHDVLDEVLQFFGRISPDNQASWKKLWVRKSFLKNFSSKFKHATNLVLRWTALKMLRIRHKLLRGCDKFLFTVLASKHKKWSDFKYQTVVLLEAPSVHI